MTEQPNGITAAISAICGELAKAGVPKDKKASGYGASFAFRGIDDVQKALAPLLAEHKVTITPEAESCEMSVRQTKSGSAMYHAVLRVRFTLRHADGSSYHGAAYGEAADNGDKAIGKAASYAFKSFALQAFCVPTESTEDPDTTVHEPSRPIAKNSKQETTNPLAPTPYENAVEAESELDGCRDLDTLLFIRDRLSVSKGKTIDGDDIKQLSNLYTNKHKELSA